MNFRLGAALLGWVLAAAFGQAQTNAGDMAYAEMGSTPLGGLHGVNLGNMLEAPHEGAWGVKVEEDYFPIIRSAGFSLLRIPISWAAHVGPGPDFTIDPAFLARIDWVVAQAEKSGFVAILDYHNDGPLMKDPDANADRFVATWKQIADHFKEAPSTIFFELLNEPNGKLGSAKWNALLAQTLAVVRASNPDRMVVVGPVEWNSIRALPKLILPESDQHLIVTFHYYDPFHFTHQGASWVGPYSQQWLGTTWGSDADRTAMAADFDKAAQWGADHHRPMFLGEFGAFSKSPIEMRAAWTDGVARNAEAHGMAWTYWEFCAGFGVYDPVARHWREPLLKSLLPKS
jgi:endoglucanase